jgi:hypothetical protein
LPDDRTRAPPAGVSWHTLAAGLAWDNRRLTGGGAGMTRPFGIGVSGET